MSTFSTSATNKAPIMTAEISNCASMLSIVGERINASISVANSWLHCAEPTILINVSDRNCWWREAISRDFTSCCSCESKESRAISDTYASNFSRISRTSSGLTPPPNSDKASASCCNRKPISMLPSNLYILSTNWAYSSALLGSAIPVSI